MHSGNSGKTPRMLIGNFLPSCIRVDAPVRRAVYHHLRSLLCVDVANSSSEVVHAPLAESFLRPEAARRDAWHRRARDGFRQGRWPRFWLTSPSSRARSASVRSTRSTRTKPPSSGRFLSMYADGKGLRGVAIELSTPGIPSRSAGKRGTGLWFRRRCPRCCVGSATGARLSTGPSGRTSARFLDLFKTLRRRWLTDFFASNTTEVPGRLDQLRDPHRPPQSVRSSAARTGRLEGSSAGDSRQAERRRERRSTLGTLAKDMGRVGHETHYFAEPFDAPAWRARWRETRPEKH